MCHMLCPDDRAITLFALGAPRLLPALERVGRLRRGGRDTKQI